MAWYHLYLFPSPLQLPTTTTTTTRFNVGEDCPVFDGLYEFCQLSASGSIGGAELLNKKSADVVINYGGAYGGVGVNMTGSR